MMTAFSHEHNDDDIMTSAAENMEGCVNEINDVSHEIPSDLTITIANDVPKNNVNKTIENGTRFAEADVSKVSHENKDEDKPTAVENIERRAKEIYEVSQEFQTSLTIDNEMLKNNVGTIENEARSADENPANGQTRFIAPKDFELLKVIGMGAFGKVLQVRNRKSQQILAMKVISKRLLKRKVSYVENVLAERNILSKIANHPFIVTMHASFQTKEKLFIIMDFCAGGELFLKLGREGIFREHTAAFYLAEITLALEHLHSINVLHRDLKPENILLESDGHCCLTDFGLAKDFTGVNSENEDERARTLCGTMEYMSPEMVARKFYGKGTDFWSLGCIAYEMLSGLPPFSSKKGSKDLFRKILNERIRMPDGASASACKLMKGLLNRDASKRLGAAKGTMFEIGGVGALKLQPFFSGLDWGKLELKEIVPPEDFSVSNDEDLRHFHEEFTNLSLPRSVKDMSKSDFLPRHCNSDNFKGFSFIGDQFPLPERSNSEHEHYWNNVDGDGHSLSDCASSVFDDDFGEGTNNIPPEPTPEKKKRPPRKKKKNQTVPLEPADEIDESEETNAKNEGEKDQPRVEVQDTIELNHTSCTTAPIEPLVSSDAEKAIMSDNNLLPVPAVKLPPRSDVESTTSSAKSVTSKLSASLNTNASWTTIGATATKKMMAPKALPSSYDKNIITSPPKSSNTIEAKKQTLASPSATTTISSADLTLKPVVPEMYKPKPGSWASMAVGKGPSTPHSNGPLQLSKAIPITPPVPQSKAKKTKTIPLQAPVLNNAAGPDWRNHVVSPLKKPVVENTVEIVNSIPPPPIPKPELNAWPSLDDFGPPLGKSKDSSSLKQTKPMGAWGSKPS